MDINELETYRLSDAIKFNDKLNPRIWGSDERMLPDVREKLLAIAEDFKQFLGVTDLEVKDITISGSNAAYTYTPHSDIDLHLVADLPKADTSDIYRELFDAKKYQYNDQHDYKIGNYDVELYVQNANQPHVSQGIYSLINDDWIKVPNRKKPTVDDISVKSKYQDIGNRIDQAIESGSLAKLEAMATRIKDLRQSGLETTGEFGPENLAFKVLRGNGTLEKLRNARLAAKDRDMSLAERKKSRRPKQKWGVFGGYYYPGFGYYPAAGEGGEGGGEGGGESIRESSNSADTQQVLRDFIKFTAEHIGIESMPKIRFKKDPAWSERNNTFGRYVPDEDTLYVSLANRHILDIMRTVAHELTHHKQNEMDPMPVDSGETGSPWENEANAMAGIIMRKFTDLHPEYFQGMTVNEMDSGQNPQPGDPIDWPEGTVHVKVSDVYDWYKLGQKLSNLKTARPEEFGSGVPETILVFNNEPQEEDFIDKLTKLGLKVHDVDPGETPGVERTSDVDESLRGRLGAAATAACIAGTPGCATTDAAKAVQTVQTVGRTAQTLKGMKADDAREELITAVKDALRKGTGTRESADDAAPSLDDPIINYDIPYTAIVRPERLQQARKFGRISHYSSPQASMAIISVPVSKERAFVDTMRNMHIPVKKSQVYEASGYIPTEREKDDPRFKMALTKDVRPGQTGKEANKLGLKTDSQGRPQLLMKRLANLLEEIKLDEKCWTGYKKQGMKKKGDRRVPNCVPVSEDESAVDETVSRFVPTQPPQVKPRRATGLRLLGEPIEDEEQIRDVLAKYLKIQAPNAVEATQQAIEMLAKRPGKRMTDMVLGDLELIINRFHVPIGDFYRAVLDHALYGYYQGATKLREDADLLEVKMSPGELRRWAESPEAEGIRAGFEAEMIFRDTSGGDSEDYEPDYEMDERARDIDEVLDFFRGGEGGISGGMANRLRESLYEEYIEWRETQIYNQWEEVADEQVRDYMETNVWGDDTTRDQYRERAAEDLGIETSEQSAERAEEIESRARELFDADVEQSIEDEDRNYDEAREYFRDMMADSDDFDQYDWFRDSYPYMSDVAEAFGLDWPYYTGGREGTGERSIDDIAQSLNYAIDMPVVASSNYHATSRRPGRWIIEPDGSLDPDEPDDELGLEIVSPPMPLPETLRKLQQVIDWANGDGNAYTNSSTGLHMGMSIPFKGGDVDYIKLILFLGDQYVLEKFERTANTYCASALDKLRQTQTARRRGVREQEVQGWDRPASTMTGAEKTAAAMDLMRKNLIELAQRYVQDGVGQSKYTSAHIKDGYIEFRSPGGDYLSLDSREDQALEDTMLRFARAMYIAGRPDLERKEYSKKLYKLLSGFKGAETSRDTKRDTKYRTKIETEDQNDAMDLFAKYSSGMINAEELKKQWAEQVLSKEAPPQRSLEDGKEYEVVRQDTGEVIDIIRDWTLASANETALVKYSGKGFDFFVRVKDTEPEKKLSRRAQVAKRIKERPSIWRVTDTNTGRSITVAADGTQDAKYQARQQDPDFQKLFYNDPDSMLVEPASAEEVKQYQVQQADNKKDSEQVQQRVQGRSGRYRVRWTERRGEREAQDSLTVDAANADAAMASIRHALQAQGRDVISIEAVLAGSTQDLQQQRTQQPAGEFTGRWNIQDALSGEVLHTISGIGNNQGDANRHAREWIERTGYSGAYEIVPEMR